MIVVESVSVSTEVVVVVAVVKSLVTAVVVDTAVAVAQAVVVSCWVLEAIQLAAESYGNGN